MSLEEKFNAAVNVIRSLPKSGSYQPSNELMLRFYSYFKQATEGPCDKPKPGFWDVVNRAKWESWKKLGDMSQDEAMQAYVDELHKIVETMSYSSDVASFLTAGDDDEGFPSDDLQLVAGDVLAKVASETNSPIVFWSWGIVESMSYSSDVASFLTAGDDDEGFPSDDLQLVAGDVLAKVASETNSPIDSRSVSGSSTPARTRHDSDDEFIDTVDSDPEVPPAPAREEPRSAPRLSNGHAHQITSQLTHLKVLEQLPATLARLEADVAALRKAVEGDRRAMRDLNSWRWPWQELSPPTLLLVVVWPFIAYRLAARAQRRHT